MKATDYIEINAGTWDDINECLTSKATAISREGFAAAKNGRLRAHRHL